MKTLFLDLDGVIAVGWVASKFHLDWKTKFMKFDTKAVQVLNEILEATGAEIVLSSDWKKHFTLQEMRDIFIYCGVDKQPISFTPNSVYYSDGHLEGGRAYEIKVYVELHGLTNWVAVDDLNVLNSGHEDFFEDHFVLCKRPNTEGIKQSGLKTKIIKILNNE
jgi:hypothetical protein